MVKIFTNEGVKEFDIDGAREWATNTRQSLKSVGTGIVVSLDSLTEGEYVAIAKANSSLF